MSDQSHIHYLNSDFDLSLGRHPSISSGLERQVRELSVQALIGAAASEAAWVRADVPSDFVSYLSKNGVPVPRLITHPQIDPARQLRPFGWNDEAIELNSRYEGPVRHPPLSVVRRVNSRSFGCGLEAVLFPDDPPGTVIESVSELGVFLGRAAAESEWVIKAEHSHAGMGNRRLGSSRLSDTDLRIVNDRLDQNDRLVIEPWLKRVCDYSVVFDVPFEIDSLRIHETICTDGGALVGAIFEPDPPADLPWKELSDAAARIAARLESEGYFGPVSVDSFRWHDGNRTRLRTLVDLNARRSMSDGAYRLWRRLVPERTLYYRFFSLRKLAGLPSELGQVVDSLGPRRYDPSIGRGILLASPLQLGLDGQSRAPGKLAVMFVSETRPETFALERWFRDEFEV